MKLILLAEKSNIIQLNLYFLRRFRLFSKKNRVLASSKLIIPQCSLLKCQYFPLNLFDAKTNYIDVGELDLHGIHRVIVGGESGPKARPMHPEWAISVQKQCAQQNVAFFFKQWGAWGADGVKRSKKANGRLFLGREWNEEPIPNL